MIVHGTMCLGTAEAWSQLYGCEVPPLAGVKECNRKEAIFLPPAAVSPSVDFGCTVDAACGGAVSLAQLHRLYAPEGYMLTWHAGRGYALLRSNHTGQDLLQVRCAASRRLRYGTGVGDGPRYTSSLEQARVCQTYFMPANSTDDVHVTVPARCLCSRSGPLASGACACRRSGRRRGWIRAASALRMQSSCAARWQLLGLRSLHSSRRLL